MSEKRQRNQQRRRRRKAQAAVRSQQRPASPEQAMAELAQLAASSVVDVPGALEAEQWASDLMATLRRPAPLGEAVDTVVFPAFVQALETLGTANALAALRALSAVGATAADAAADRLAAAGLVEPAWGTELGRSRPVAAALVQEPAFDDGVTVMVEFTEPGGELHAVGVYVDHNLGGLAKDAFFAEPLAEVRKMIDNGPDRGQIMMREVGLGEARARIEAAFDSLDHTLAAPVDEQVHSLRALIEARLNLLPGDFELPETYVEVTRKERDALLGEFLASPEGERWRGDEDAEFAAQLAIDYGCDYNHGGPLRWSPAVVALFMLDWLGRKVMEEPAFFARVPEVLESWVSYAGRRRELAIDRVQEAVAAVAECRDEMLATVGDPDAWGPAKMLAAGAAEAGVDLTDRESVDRFLQQYNERLPG